MGNFCKSAKGEDLNNAYDEALNIVEPPKPKTKMEILKDYITENLDIESVHECHIAKTHDAEPFFVLYDFDYFL